MVSIIQAITLGVALVFSSQVFAQSTLDQEINSLGLNVQNPKVANASASQNSGSAASSEQSDQGLIGNEIRVLLKPRRTTLLAAESSGQVRSFPFDIGDSFKKGEPLLKIRCSKFYAQIEVSQAQVNTRKIEYESNKSLLTQGGVSKFDVELSRAQVLESEASLKSDKISTAGCSMAAPYNGKVVSVLTKRYEYVNNGQPVIEIIDDSRLDMQLYVPSIWVTKLEKKDVFKVYIDEVGKSYDAEVLRINPRVDAESKTLEVIAGLTKQHKELRAGMSGNAQFGL